MPTNVNKVDSNATGLAWAQEDSYKTVSGDEIWYPLEPNEYDDFGGQVTTVARNPINSSRQRRKGVVTDIDSSGGFTVDLTYNLRDFMQGLFFADLRKKGEQVITAIDLDSTNPDEFEMADTTGFRVNDLVYATGVNSANRGPWPVTAVVSNTSVEVADGSLTAETVGANALLRVVGHQFAAGDLDVTVSGNYATLTTASKDLTQLGIIPGEWIFIGGDSASLRFTNAVNNGWKRVKSITANAMVIDKSDSDMVNETSTTETVQIFLGSVLKNEDAAQIIRRTYQIERTLGAPDTAQPSQIQSEYLTGAVFNECSFNVPTADKATADLSFVGADFEQRTGATGVKAGTRATYELGNGAFNTSSNVVRNRLAVISSSDEAPTDLFSYIQEYTLTVNNNVTPNKAVGVLGSFDVTAGTFEVMAEMTAFFQDITALQSVRNNDSVTFDSILVKDNQAIAIDIPYGSLGDGRPEVSQDEAITLPLELMAANGVDYDSNMDHTLLMTFFDYVPNLAAS